MIRKVPFDCDGNLERQPNIWGLTEWRTNVPFEAALTFVEARRMPAGGSAFFLWKDEHGHEFPMLPADMESLLKQAVINFGRVQNFWIVGKRGTSYGIRIAQTSHRSVKHRVEVPYIDVP